MSDSDEDEFVSASEGEEEEEIPLEKKKEKDEIVIGKKEDKVMEVKEEVEKESEDEEEEEANDTTKTESNIETKSDEDSNEESEEPAKVEERDQLPSEDELEEEKKRESRHEEERDEEQNVPDVSNLRLDEEPTTVNRKESTSSESSKEKKEWEKVEEIEESSVEEEGKSGWDEWGEDAPVENSPSVEKKQTKSVEKKKEVKKEEVEEDTGDGWDDWGSDQVTEEAVREEKKKEDPKKSDDEKKREELLNRLGGGVKGGSNSGGGGGWGWGGMLSGIGETFSSAVESSLGLPSAHEVARRHVEVEKMEGETPVPRESSAPSSNQPQSSFGGFGMFSGIVNGGIDVLESIGKKTFETITVREEEAGRRRFIFEADRGENLSDVLKELRERNEAEAAVSALGGISSSSSPRLPDMASSFERSDGMIHLEALELVATNRPKQKPSVHRHLMALLENERVDSIDNDDDFAAELRAAIKETGLPYAPDGIILVDMELDTRIRSGDGKESEELFKEGVESLVQFTAASVHLVSKLASLLAVMGGSDFSPFLSIYRILSTRCTHIANLYMLAISATDSGTTADELGTQVLVESSTAIDFIRQAHVLLIPIIEVK